MAFLVVVISTSDSIGELNSKAQAATKPHDEAQKLINYLSGMQGGQYPATFQVVTRDSDPSVSTSGAGSLSLTYSLK